MFQRCVEAFFKLLVFLPTALGTKPKRQTLSAESFVTSLGDRCRWFWGRAAENSGNAFAKHLKAAACRVAIPTRQIGSLFAGRI
jgi:hypothetical protein